MKNKGLFILGVIILANTSYADEKQVEVITSNIELQRIFMQTTLDEVEKGLPKKYANTVKEIPVITLDVDKNDNVVVKNIETTDMSVHNDKKEYDIPDFVQTQRTVKKWTAGDIENYYKQKRHINKKVNDVNKSQGDLTIHFSNGTNFANTQELVELYNYINTNNIKSIKLVGHSDKTGNAKQNAEISVYRADKVKQELIKYGIKKDMITITGKAHLEPVDTVNIKRNRRVEVYFIKEEPKVEIPKRQEFGRLPFGCEVNDRVCTIYGFKVDGKEPNAEEKASLIKIVNVINKFAQNGTIDIVGHTDSTGRDEYNLKLSKQRAKNVVRLLKEHGLSPNITVDKIMGYGEKYPKADNKTEKGRYQNRRVDLFFQNVDFGNVILEALE